MMKGVPHISICQQLLNEKLLGNIYLKIGHLLWTISDFNLRCKLTIFFHIEQRIQVDERGVLMVDSIVLVVVDNHTINKQQLKMH
jgi:hypothetical protein